MTRHHSTDPARLARIVADIRRRSGRMTAPRQAIIEHLLVADGHVTADELAARVQEELPEVHLSTVYRTLDTLEEIGVVDHVHLGHGRAVYHLADQRHQHLVCDNCAMVLEVPDSLFAELADTLLEQYGFTIRPHHFAVPGLCHTCRTTAEAASQHAVADHAPVDGHRHR